MSTHNAKRRLGKALLIVELLFGDDVGIDALSEMCIVSAPAQAQGVEPYVRFAAFSCLPRASGSVVLLEAEQKVSRREEADRPRDVLGGLDR